MRRAIRSRRIVNGLFARETTVVARGTAGVIRTETTHSKPRNRYQEPDVPRGTDPTPTDQKSLDRSSDVSRGTQRRYVISQTAAFHVEPDGFRFERI